MELAIGHYLTEFNGHRFEAIRWSFVPISVFFVGLCWLNVDCSAQLIYPALLLNLNCSLDARELALNSKILSDG